MTIAQNIIVTCTASENLAPEDGYWLIIEQVKDEPLTAGEVAEIIDELFDLTPCKDPIVTGKEPKEEPPADMGEVLEKTDADLSACERRLTGTYQVDLRIVRSHPDLPYVLRLSAGKILETVVNEKSIVITVDVKDSSSVTLTLPVRSSLSCSWMGSVINKTGAINPPIIRVKGNTLFWDGKCTGTIRAEFHTVEDLVTVEIPGVPNYVGSDLGKTQDAVALAFYHYQVYSCDTTPPVDEDETTLAEVCGWEQSKTGIPDDDPEPEPPPDPVQEYGCIDYFPLAPAGSPVTEPWFYREKCCVDGQHDGCKVRTSRIEGGKDLDEVTRARLTADWAGPIEFIGLGPITPAGCGTRYEETIIRPQNCCEDATPIVWDRENSVEVLADNTSGTVAVIGGVTPYYWSVRGNGFSFDGQSLRDAITDVPYIRVFTGDACGFAPIEVTDGCSVVNGGVRSTNGVWQQVFIKTGGIGSFGCPDVFVGTGAWGSVANHTDIGISGQYRITQQSGLGDGYYGIFSTRAAAIARCEEIRSAPPPQDQIAGQCFDYPPLCMECGECSVGGFDVYYTRKVGFHSTINSENSFWGAWFIINYTRLEKWVC